jgi:predicted nucleic acid-binding protein
MPPADAPEVAVLDASVAVRWVVTEEGSAEAVELLERDVTSVADDVIRVVEDERIVAPALRLALSLGHKVPDCLYLALAEREGASLATADARLARLAASRGVRVHRVPRG